jgi:hypothetical protein
MRLLGLDFGGDAIWLMQSSVYNTFSEIKICFQVVSLRQVLGLMLCCFRCRSRFVCCLCAPSLLVSMLGFGVVVDLFCFGVVLWAAVLVATLLRAEVFVTALCVLGCAAPLRAGGSGSGHPPAILRLSKLGQ